MKTSTSNRQAAKPVSAFLFFRLKKKTLSRNLCAAVFILLLLFGGMVRGQTKLAIDKPGSAVQANPGSSSEQTTVNPTLQAASVLPAPQTPAHLKLVPATVNESSSNQPPEQSASVNHPARAKQTAKKSTTTNKNPRQ